jgi:hypothetical protein
MNGGIINSITRLHLVGYFFGVILRCTVPWILNLWNCSLYETQYNCSSDHSYDIPEPSSNYMYHLCYIMKLGILRRSVCMRARACLCVCACACACFRWCVEQIPGNFLNIIKLLVFLMKVGCVLCEVRYEVLFKYNLSERRSTGNQGTRWSSWPVADPRGSILTSSKQFRFQLRKT